MSSLCIFGGVLMLSAFGGELKLLRMKRCYFAHAADTGTLMN